MTNDCQAAILEAQLRASLSLIKMQQALEAVLPLATDEYAELHALSLFATEDTAAKQAADADAALKSTGDKSPALELLHALALSAQPGKEAEAIDALSKLIAAAPNSPEGKQALLRRA